jgi:replicative DNA helicase
MLKKVAPRRPKKKPRPSAGLLIAKKRNSLTGGVHLTFLKSYARFESAAKVSGEDVPDRQSE